MSRKSCPRDPRFVLTSHAAASAVLLAACLLAPPAALAGGDDWVTFADETATRIVSDPGVGVDDVQEKDYASGDVDRDGDTDLVVVRKQPFTCPGGFPNVLFMNENGVMTDRTATLAPDFLDATNDRDVELVDVDGDDWLDIVTGGTFEEQPRILMNLGDDAEGTWLGFEYDASRLPVLESAGGVGPFFCGLAVGDLTGDERPEIYFTDYGGLLTSEADDLDDVLLVNNGSGFFTDETDSRLGVGIRESLFGTDADIADMNGDTFNDIIKDNATGFVGPCVAALEGRVPEGIPSSTVSILYNDGTGHFSTFDVVNSDSPYMVAPADFTQDGRLDLFIVEDSQDRYLINTGNNVQGEAQFNTQSLAGSPNTIGFGGNVKFADLDGDDVLDVLVADVDTDAPGCERQLVLLQGQGVPPAITYADPLVGASRPWTPLGTFDVEALDIDGNGALDLWIGTCDGTLVFMGDPALFRDGFESGNLSSWSATVP